MKKILTSAVLLFTSMLAFSQSNYPRDIELSWTNPSNYVDGTSIQPGDLDFTRLVCDRHDGVNFIDQNIPLGADIPGGPSLVVLTGAVPKPGTYNCSAFSVTIDGTSSDASNVVAKKYTGKPVPPANLIIL